MKPILLLREREKHFWGLWSDNGSGYGVGFLRISNTKLNTMTKEEIFEMFDRYDAYETLDTGETVQVIHWHDLKHIAEELVKNCSIPAVVGQSEQLRCDKCGSKEIEVWDNHSNCKKCLNTW